MEIDDGAGRADSKEKSVEFTREKSEVSITSSIIQKKQKKARFLEATDNSR